MGLPQAELSSSECTAQNSEIEAGKCPCTTWASGEASCALYSERDSCSYVLLN